MAEAESSIVPIDRAASKPYSLVLAYPTSDGPSVQSRISQLEHLQVSSLVFEGPLKLDGLSLMGKGVAGMVVIGVAEGRRIALKIRRVDSRRKDVLREARMLQLANEAGIGPRYIASTQDVLAMELVEGQRLPLWLTGLRGRGRKRRVKGLVRNLLEQCYRLDSRNIDHGEISRAHKNIIVGANDLPSIVDFESASLKRRPSNVTSLTQYLFLGESFARKIRRILGPVAREKLLQALRRYKSGDESALQSIFQVLNV